MTDQNVLCNLSRSHRKRYNRIRMKLLIGRSRLIKWPMRVWIYKHIRSLHCTRIKSNGNISAEVQYVVFWYYDFLFFTQGIGVNLMLYSSVSRCFEPPALACVSKPSAGVESSARKRSACRCAFPPRITDRNSVVEYRSYETGRCVLLVVLDFGADQCVDTKTL